MVKKVCSAVSRQQRNEQQVEKPRPTVETPFSLFPPAPKTWQHQNEKVPIEADRGAKRVLWHR